MNLSVKSIDETLDCLLRAAYNDRSPGARLPDRENRIFTNRNIKLARIKAIGFDMDYTLAQYTQESIDRVTMRLALNTLIEDKGYPESLRQLPYREAFAIRGLVVDTELGNVLKVDKFRYVSLAYHGLHPLPSHERAASYNNAVRIDFDSGRYRPVDTLFELLEIYLYAAIIDQLEGEGLSVAYRQLYEDLRGAVDQCHADGSLKQEIMQHPDQFIQDDAMLIPALHKFIEAGKRLFVVTNSEPDYTRFVLDYLFRNSEPFFDGWRSCFEIVCCFSGKPGFFKEGRPRKIIEDDPILFFSGGNIAFLEERLGVSGDRVLYVGDHIYGDILKSKHNSTWRNCIIVPELTFQIRAQEQTRPFLERLHQNETRRKQLSMEMQWQRAQTHDLEQFKHIEADELEPEHFAKIDARIRQINDRLEANHRELSQLLHESRKLRADISGGFNCFWGRLFKTGGQLSMFAEQIRDYACIYTSSVSNFNYYGAADYLESTVTPMPHEKNLYNLGDLNFDISMEEEMAIVEKDDGPASPQAASRSNREA